MIVQTNKQTPKQRLQLALYIYIGKYTLAWKPSFGLKQSFLYKGQPVQVRTRLTGYDRTYKEANRDDYFINIQLENPAFHRLLL